MLQVQLTFIPIQLCNVGNLQIERICMCGIVHIEIYSEEQFYYLFLRGISPYAKGIY